MKEYDNDYRMLEMYSQLSRDETDKWYKEQDIGLRGRDLDITENQYSAQNEIAWAEIGLQDKDMQQKYNLAYAQLNQDDRHFVDDLLYRYNVMTEEGKQFWAKLAQDGEIADKEIKLEYDKLDQNTKNFLMEYALDVEKLEFEKDVHADEVRLTEAEIQLQYDKLDEEKRQHIKNLAFEEYSLAMTVGQWSEENELRARELGIEENKIKKTASLQEWENATAAAEFGDFSHLKKLGVNTDSYEALWNAQVEEKLNPAEEEELPTEDDIPEDVVDAVAGQNIMKKPSYPSGYDLNAATIDSLAADAPTYKAKADAEKAAYEATPEGKHESHMTRYRELEDKKGITTNEIVEREALRKALLIYDDIDNIRATYNRLLAKHPKTVEEARQQGLLEKDIRTYEEYFGA